MVFKVRCRNKGGGELVEIKDLLVPSSATVSSPTSTRCFEDVRSRGGPRGFLSRLCAIHGGTFMLNIDVNEILFDGEGAAWGIKCGDEVAKGTMVIGDPSYFPKETPRRRSNPRGRSSIPSASSTICFLNHPIPNTNNSESAQIITPWFHRRTEERHLRLHGIQRPPGRRPGDLHRHPSAQRSRRGTPGGEILSPGCSFRGTHTEEGSTASSRGYRPVDDGLSDRSASSARPSTPSALREGRRRHAQLV